MDAEPLTPHHLIICVCNLFGGGCRGQGYDHINNYRDKERGKQFINRKYTAKLCNTVFPDEDHCAACDHSEEGSPFIGTFPKQCAKYNRSKCSAEARPGKGHNFKDRTVRVGCQNNSHQGDHDNGNSGDLDGRIRPFVFLLSFLGIYTPPKVLF